MTEPHSSKPFPPLPHAFQGREAKGWASHSTAGADISQFLVGRARNFVYCIRDHATRQAVLIDPHDGAEFIVSDLHRQGYTLTSIWLTHTHWDHIGGIRSSAQIAGKRIPVRSSSPELARLSITADDPLLETLPFEWEAQQKTSTQQLGATEITLHLTPGHSPGAVCYGLHAGGQQTLLTGDTLFIGDCGRTDLPGGNPKQLWESLRYLKELPDHTLIFPGHHYSPPLAAWLGEQKLNNPALAIKTFEEFVALP